MTADDPVQIRACVLREPGQVATETVTLAPPRAGEVRVRVAAAGVCHSDLHLVEGSLGPGRWLIVLGHEGAGVVESVGDGVEQVAPGDRVVFSMIAPCGQCDQCRAGRRTLCGPAGEHAFAGMMRDGTSRLTGSDGAVLQHGFSVACFAERAVLGAGAVVPIADAVPLWQASLLGCGVVTGFGAVTQASVRIGENVCVIGCGGVGLQVIAAAALAGAGTIVAVDRRPEKLEHALGAEPPTPSTHLRDDPAGEIRALTGGGAEHAFEVIGNPRTIRLAWDALAPGGTAVVVGLAPAGAEVSLPAIEFLSEKSIIGSYYGSADPLLSLGELAGLVQTGRLQLADVVSHLIELDQIPDALERLRRSEGDRSVVVIDPELAQTTAKGAL